MQKRESRLQETISPTNYNIFLEPNLNNFTFKEKVEIQINIKRPTTKIILNSSELKIKKAKIIYNQIYNPKKKKSKKEIKKNYKNNLESILKQISKE